jgi:hypothetical protein
MKMTTTAMVAGFFAEFGVEMIFSGAKTSFELFSEQKDFA